VRTRLFLGVGIALLVAACRGPATGPFREAPVVLVSIDTLRADRVGCYGYSKGRTPNLDRLAREGVVFDSAWSHCPLTLPAHASLLTGLLPPRHGVRDNVGFTLQGSHRTLASRFKAAGLATGGAVSAYVLRRATGIAQGFDMYEDALPVDLSIGLLGAQQRDGGIATEALARGREGSDARSSRSSLRPRFLQLSDLDTLREPQRGARGAGVLTFKPARPRRSLVPAVEGSSTGPALRASLNRRPCLAFRARTRA
jgi:hypothetical protein